jgi:NAD+ synthase (glutamine-hydrolysing)
VVEKSFIRVGLCQTNPLVGDLQGNIEKLRAAYEVASAADCDVTVFPELSLVGYTPEDLLKKPGFIRDNHAALESFAAATRNCAAVVGFIDSNDSQLFNAAALCRNGKVEFVYHKQQLPNYSVFDEARYFEPGTTHTGPRLNGLTEICGFKVGISICEDIWFPEGPVQLQSAAGAQLILNINGSPFHQGKGAEREEMISLRAKENGCAIVYVNQVGGQDELVFDGSSLVVDANGSLVGRMAAFSEDFEYFDVGLDGVISSEKIKPRIDGLDALYKALVLGTRDYVRKNGFSDVAIGLSGGIDSSLVAAIAVEALGADHVHGVAMPSRYSSSGSLTDAATLAENLGISHRVISIEPSFSANLEMLSDSFSGLPSDLTEENLQSRCRGMTLMALSNKFRWMVMTTGNKSEVAVGYFTIYGDSAGGYAAIKDVYKTEVFELCRYVNKKAGREIIPEAVITKPPSAELRPDQRDDQSLPPYEVLDAILRLYVDGDRTPHEISSQGFDNLLVERICRLVDISEHKRRQTAPGARVSLKSFGKDRRVPITNGYR